MSGKLNAADFDNVIALIESIFKSQLLFGKKNCVPACGYTTDEITQTLRTYFPANAMTDAEVVNTLLRGARSGVFTQHCAAGVSSEEVACDETAVPVYKVNSGMAAKNPANAIYQTYFNGPEVVTHDPCFVVNSRIGAGLGGACTVFTKGNLDKTC